MIGQELVEVRVRPCRTSVFCNVTDETVSIGDWVLTEIEGEQECGRVIRGPIGQEDIEGLDEEIGKVLRKATSEDIETLRKNQKLEQEAFKAGRQKVTEHELPMKLITVDVIFDQSKIKFYFTSDGRVDFRELVRDLAHIYKTRIEMRQIGVRDGAKMVGGIGVCGLPLCCASWMRKFVPITIKMAKEQDLSLNPQKISGQCSRLLCCLSYEVETYKACKQGFPKLGRVMETPKGRGPIQQINILKGTITVRVDDLDHEFLLSELKEYQDQANPVPPVPSFDSEQIEDEEA